MEKQIRSKLKYHEDNNTSEKFLDVEKKYLEHQDLEQELKRLTIMMVHIF